MKDIYETRADAEAAAQYLLDLRGVSLKAYSCPQNSGWHLTKNIEEAEIFAYETFGKSWELIEEKENSVNDGELCVRTRVKKSENKIIKIECKNRGTDIETEGRIVEIIKNVNIEKRFSLDFNNIFALKMAGDFVNQKTDQITIHASVPAKKIIESYTFLIRHRIYGKKHPEKGEIVKVILACANIGNASFYHCTKIEF